MESATQTSELFRYLSELNDIIETIDKFFSNLRENCNQNLSNSQLELCDKLLADAESVVNRRQSVMSRISSPGIRNRINIALTRLDELMRDLSEIVEDAAFKAHLEKKMKRNDFHNK